MSRAADIQDQLGQEGFLGEVMVCDLVLLRVPILTDDVLQVLVRDHESPRVILNKRIIQPSSITATSISWNMRTAIKIPSPTWLP
jgi:hypothetical protein